MESKTKFLKKDVNVWEETLTLHKRKTRQGRYGLETVTQYFPVKYQYETFNELQIAIDNNLPPLQLVKVDSLFNNRNYDDYDPYDYDDDEISKTDIKLHREIIRNIHADTREFLTFFFTLYNNECVTIDNKGRTTCSIGKRRSLVDIYRICKFYYPTISLKEVKEALWDISVGLDVFICPDIRRRVHRRNPPAHVRGNISYNDADEFGWDYYCTNVKDSKYFKLPYKELVKMINKIGTIELCPVPLQRVNPDVVWYAGNNYKNEPTEIIKPSEPVLVTESQSSELPF